ncbi:MAG: transcription termination/antitermination protein NusA, partial [Patescibacteria group bacterium]
IVPEDQLSLAIGIKGQNVRLAAKLTGWKIDIAIQEKKKVKKIVKKKEEPKKKSKEVKKPRRKVEIPTSKSIGKNKKKIKK